MIPEFRIHWKSFSLFICISICSCVSQAEPLELAGQWYQTLNNWGYQGQYELNERELKSTDKVDLTGGYFVHQVNFEITHSARYVVDFSTSSIIGYFRHTLLNEQGDLIASMQGGIENHTLNPFFLRHGREVFLAQGRYRLITELKSTFFLATPQVYLNDIDSYRQSIKLGNTLSLICLGFFISMMLYYATLAIIRRHLANALYSLFILGNLLFNSMALLVLPDLFGLHWIYGVSGPILFSNCIYILFVMSLLQIQQQTHPRLYLIGKSLLILLGALIVLAILKPNWSLEIDRYGVGLFLFYGLSTGIVRALEGNTTAKLYLFAIGTFFVFGIFTILLEDLGSYTLYIEHMGLISVTVEVMLLALVLSYQFARLNFEKEKAVKRMQRSKYLSQVAITKNKELKKLHQEAISSVAKKSQFLANMSHEIRTPMNAIIGMTQLVQKTELSLKQRNYLDKIYGSAYALLRIINDILDFSKFESGNLTLEHIEFKIEEVTQYLNNLVPSLVKDKPITVSFVVEPNVPEVFLGDSLRLGQVLLNLLTNAIKFTKKGSVTLTIKQLNSDQNQAELLFSVVDTGIGLSEEQQVHLFGVFTQADLSISRLYGGTGLGLAICKQLVEGMGGEIGVESNLGMGSTFFFTAILDIQHKDTVNHLATSSNSPEDKLEFNNSLILLVEDNLINQEIMQEMLEDNGFHVDIANNGIEAISLINQYDYAIVLMDCQMAEMDGYEATRVIRSDPANKELPIIALTANVMKEELELCLSSGMNDHISKPVEWDVFFKKIAQWVQPIEIIPPTQTNIKVKHNKGVIDLTDNLPGFDFENIRAMIPKNQKKILSMLKLFHQQLSTNGEFIAEQVSGRKLMGVEKELHELMSSTAALGAIELHLASIALEEEWRRGHYNEKTFKCWDKAFNTTKDTLNKLLNQSLSAESKHYPCMVREQILQKVYGLLMNDAFIEDEQLLLLEELLADDEHMVYQQLHGAIFKTNYQEALSVIGTLMTESSIPLSTANKNQDKRAIILIVDDIRVNQEIMSSLLDQEFCVKVASNGNRALELSQQALCPDLILLDMHMPEMDGYEVCHKLQQNPVSRDIPVIFITASSNDELEINALQLGAADYITKPINSHTLIQRIRNQLLARQHTSELKYVAHYDSLTGIPNRLLLTDRLNQGIASAKREQTKLAVCYIDLDGFKLINDTYGHHVGDFVLIEVVSRIAKILRESDTVARIGGDEFVVLLADFSAQTECFNTLQRLHKAIARPIDIQNHTVSVTASTGVCVFPDRGLSAEVLLRNADQAMYEAKRKGKDCYKVYDESMVSNNIMK